MKIGPILVALLVIMPVSKSMAGCYGRTDARPQSRFILCGAEAFDTKTGLTWQRCSLGMTWNVKRGCVGEIMSVGLDEAIKTAETLSGKWRVPSGPEWRVLSIARAAAPWLTPVFFPTFRRMKAARPTIGQPILWEPLTCTISLTS
jgi:hypothetical protein